MRAELNHTIVAATDKRASAEFVAGILGLELGAPWGPFQPVALSNGTTLEYLDSADVHPNHYAFLVDDEDFDAVFGRVRAAGITYFADPFLQRPGEINHLYGGRGVYFHDPDGHILEVITQPYGPAPESEEH
jgi:catechol 2,3-dioxygenase-like lactoylglutathione lyase family enzyme